MIQRVQQDFVALALRANVVNGIDAPSNREEGRIYQRIKRSKAAPQGICVLNPTGQVLDWALSFKNEQAVIDFLDYSLLRYWEFPSRAPDVVQRFQQYPGRTMPEFQETVDNAPIVASHAEGAPCVARLEGKPARVPGDLAARVYGRVVDEEGKLCRDTVRQEDYSEDNFTVPVAMQTELILRLKEAGADPVTLPQGLARLAATYAYLGHIDVRPLDNPRGGEGELKHGELQAQRVNDAAGTSLWRVWGRTEVAGELALNRPGGHWHEVTLDWNGFLEIRDDRVTQLILSATGTEGLRYGQDPGFLDRAAQADERTYLMAGRPIRLSSGVRYGIVARPVEPVRGK